MGYESLYLAQFAVQAGTALYQQQLDDQQAAIQRQNAYRQAALNNQVAYNSFLHINQEQILDLKKFGFEKFDLRKQIRRELAKNQAINASIGGGFGRSGNSAEAVNRNIERHGFNALARKDLNRDIRMRSFDQRRRNVTLDTMSKNNTAFSGLSLGGDTTGTILQIAGSGIQNYTASKVGTT